MLVNKLECLLLTCDRIFDTSVKNPYACELLDQLLLLNPRKCCESDAAMNHAFFWTDPLPCDVFIVHTHSMFKHKCTIV
jgi:hypothetical protein